MTKRGRPTKYTDEIADENPKTAVIYALIDPRNGEKRYIGKANDAKKRLASHIRDSRRRQTPVCDWIKKLVSFGMVPEMMVLETVPYENWQAKEKQWIAEMRQKHALLNVASGGDEPVVSKSSRKQAAQKGANNRDYNLWHLKLQMGILLKSGNVTKKTKQKLKNLAARYPDKFAEYADL